MDDIRMTDERDEEGSGFLSVEMKVGNIWTGITRTWFWKGIPHEVWVVSDEVNEIQISQFTNMRTAWTKRQNKNMSLRKTRHFNMTTLKRKDATLNKKGE